MIRVVPRRAHWGRLYFRNLEFPCALGRTGVTAIKREGDGATPRGLFALRALYYRPDRMARPICPLPATAIAEMDGWCDDPTRPEYNRPVVLPFAGATESLWRDDALYDLLVVIGHNDRPPRAGHGSAIFLHIAGPGLPATRGCVALERRHLLQLLARIDRATRIRVM